MRARRQRSRTRSEGTALDPKARAAATQRLGEDPGDVRIHADAGAADQARRLDARAFVVGRDIYFGAGEFAPHTREGFRLLAHELVHAIQQRGLGGPSHHDVEPAVAATDGPLEAEASRLAEVGSDGRGVVGAATAPVIQRQLKRRTPVNPEVANLSGLRYVDAFVNAQYDLNYRFDPKTGSLSTWLRVSYRDGQVIDINIYSIGDETMSPDETSRAQHDAHLGDGGRIFPSKLNRSTTPRLWQAKQDAIAVMEQSNEEFMMLALAGVMVNLPIGPVVGPAPEVQTGVRPYRPRPTVRTPPVEEVPVSPTVKPRTPTGGGARVAEPPAKVPEPPPKVQTTAPVEEAPAPAPFKVEAKVMRQQVATYAERPGRTWRDVGDVDHTLKRHMPGGPGKGSKFPSSWSQDDVLEAGYQAANNGTLQKVGRERSMDYYRGTYKGVTVRAQVRKADQTIVTVQPE